MPGVPEHAVILANSEGCPRQIIRFAPNVYGFQCHLEFDKPAVQAIIDNCSKELTTDTYVQSKETMLSQAYDEINGYLKHFLDRFLSNTQ